jgi:pSer/pThr/pTyr-binding forkhead associated (FHA) protein
MWKLTIEDDQANRTVVHLVRDDYSVGRAENNAIRLTERNVSRSHARLQRHGTSWLLADHRSYNGCYVNGQRVSEAHDLDHGDLIQLGDYRLIVEDDSRITAQESEGATIPASRTTPSLGPTVDRLVILVGPSPGSEFALSNKPMLIGRGEECDIAINHQSVSRVHAEIVPLGDGRYEITDRNSANGVRVNGVELPRSFIESRDVIELGDAVLKYIPAGDSYIPATDESLQIAASGAARRREAEEALLPALSATSLGVKIAIGAACLALVAVLVAALVSRRPANELISAPDGTAEKSARTLAEARQLLRQGDVRGAQQKAAELPLGSPARSSQEFRAIQAAYADHLFALADKASHPADKRALYDEIARTTSIDSLRRQRANDRLNALGAAEAVNIADLPKSIVRPPVPSASQSARKQPGAAPDFSEPGGDERPRQSTPTRAEKPAAREKAPAEPTTLVRENPFDVP